MDSLLQNGIAMIIAFQGLGDWLTAPMRFFTFLSSQEFLLLVLPVVYWSINPSLGARIGFLLLLTNGLNEVFKLAIHGPRPYWINPQVKALAFEPTFGAPSGHTQTAVVIWGLIAAQLKRPWAWAVAIGLILLVGLSRIYLGVHFLHDVVLGWLIGAVILWAFLRWSDAVTAWLKRQSLGMQIALAFGLSVLMLLASSAALFSLSGWTFPAEWANSVLQAGAPEAPDPLSLNNSVTSAGATFGLLAGLAWITSQGGFSARGPFKLRATRFVIGVIGLLILWYGLGKIFPDDDTLIAYILRYLRYTLVGCWISAGAPLVFLKLHLAEKGRSNAAPLTGEM